MTYVKLSMKVKKKPKLFKSNQNVSNVIYNYNVAQTEVRKLGKVGRPRIVPYDFDTPTQVRETIGKKIKDMNKAELRAYNRVANRLDYARTRQLELYGETAQEYKKKLNKTIKQMTKKERNKYNRLAKSENRLLKP